MYQGQPAVGDTITREDMLEIQREQEARLLGTFFIQAIFLALAIMLYATWDWSQFGQPWEAALFYGLLSFSLQAALYFSYRTMFEDSTNYRKELKRMKNKQKRSMAQMSFEMRKMQTENLLQQQMAQYKAQMQMAQADGIITPDEQAMLNHQMAQIQNTAQTSGLGNMDIEELARQLGIDRFRLGPIPLGPKLTVAQQPVNNVVIPSIPDNKLDLDPSNEKSAEAQLQKNLQ
tara:strand:+ start:247 stop:942 length:696 start_codon:yes stop_codon:yes gene_type:complete